MCALGSKNAHVACALLVHNRSYHARWPEITAAVAIVYPKISEQ
jgi:hypothetical protein